MPALPIEPDQIVITAARVPEAEDRTAASVTIVDRKRIERLGEPLVPALLRLVPSAAVATTGPAGSLTEVRIRGAEANHTLLFIDGIRANDPAAGDTPRFELLNADLASRIEVVRGPQSALWGSDAIGGVVAISGLDEPGLAASGEAGSFGFRRASASAGIVGDTASMSAAVGWQRATGIDSFDGHGDKDGYRNFSGRLRGTWTIAPAVELGASGFALTGRSKFDGFDPVTFIHRDTLDNSRNRLAAGRAWLRLGSDGALWSGHVAASILGSSNRNLLGDDPVNRTTGKRSTLEAQVEHRFRLGPVASQLIAAAEAEGEQFHSRDIIYGGFSDQDRRRSRQALTLEWRGETKALSADIALRRDLFNRFSDATSLRASLLGRLGGGFALSASYAEGIAQPTFFDLYGFFPGSFVGNPVLKPESSRGGELSLRYRRGAVDAALTAYRQRLHDEIVDTYDPATFLSSTANRAEASHRSGVEAEFGWQIGDRLRLSANYAFLHATQPDDAGASQSREVRRPRHSGSLALDGAVGRFSYGASLAYSGKRLDRRDVYPYDIVALDAYWLAGARVAYAVSPRIDLYARMSNAFGAHYQDVFGYRTEGRGIFAGIRLASRR